MPPKTAALTFLCFVPALLALALISSPATPAGPEPVLAESAALPADEPVSQNHRVYLPLLSKVVWRPVTFTNHMVFGEAQVVTNKLDHVA